MTVKEICESTDSVIGSNGSVPQNALRRAVGLPEIEGGAGAEQMDAQRVIEQAGAAATMNINNLIDGKNIEKELAGIRKELHTLNTILERWRKR